ncbi:MAG: hypothetical protein QGF00_30830 [Planctomycetota bacterium]|jgi:hypothetical protein|nr:hypothetical protein [Planctomycetota bacterium]
MNRSTSMLICAGAIAGLFLFPGCGPKKRDRKGANLPAEGAKGVPNWVTKGSGAFKDGKKGKAFYGVGAVSGVKNYSLLRRSAENAARVEVGRIFDTYVTSLAKSYARSVSNFDASQEEQLIQDASKAFTNVTLTGIQVGEHYYDQPTKTMYVYAFLDTGVFKNAIQKAQQLGEEFRKHVKENSDGAFTDLSNEGK